MGRFCTNCGAELDERDHFCIKCGAKIDALRYSDDEKHSQSQGDLMEEKKKALGKIHGLFFKRNVIHKKTYQHGLPNFIDDEILKRLEKEIKEGNLLSEDIENRIDEMVNEYKKNESVFRTVQISESKEEFKKLTSGLLMSDFEMLCQDKKIIPAEREIIIKTINEEIDEGKLKKNNVRKRMEELITKSSLGEDLGKHDIVAMVNENKKDEMHSLDKIQKRVREYFAMFNESEYNSYDLLDLITITSVKYTILPKDFKPGEKYDPIEINEEDKYLDTRKRRVESSFSLGYTHLNLRYKKFLRAYDLSDFDGYEIRFKILEDINELDLTGKDIKKRLTYYIHFKTHPSKKVLQEKTGYGLYIFNDSQERKLAEYEIDISQNKINKENKDSFINRFKDYNLRANFYDKICEDVLSKIDEFNLSPDEVVNEIDNLLNEYGVNQDGETILHNLTGFSRNGEYEFYDEVLKEMELKGISSYELEGICKRIIIEIENNALKNNEVKDRLDYYVEESYAKTLDQFFHLVQHGFSCELKRKEDKTRVTSRVSGGSNDVEGKVRKYDGFTEYYVSYPSPTVTFVESEDYEEWNFGGCVVYFLEDQFRVDGNQIFYKDITDLGINGDEVYVVHNDKWRMTFRMPTDRWISDEKTRLIYKSGFYNIINERGRNIPHWFFYGFEDPFEDKKEEIIPTDEPNDSNDNEINEKDNLEKSVEENNKEAVLEENIQNAESVEDKLACPKCGKTLGNDFAFCPYCGYDIIKKACPKCLTVYWEDYTHCPKCGIRLCTSDEIDEFVAQVKKAHECYDKKDYNQAIDILKVQLEHNPNPDDILFLLGDCYYCLNDYCNANEYLDKLIEINPNYENLWFKKAQIASNQKDYVKEEEYGLKEIELHPNNKEAYLLLMDCYIEKKEDEKFDSILDDLSKLKDGKDYLMKVYFLLEEAGDGETEETRKLKEKIKNVLI